MKRLLLTLGIFLFLITGANAATPAPWLFNLGNSTLPTSAGTVYVIPVGGNSTSAAEANREIVVPANGTISNLYIQTSQAPGTGNQWAFTLRVDEEDKTLTCAVADANTTNTDLTHQIAVTAGQRVSLKLVTSGTPTASTYLWCGLIFTPSVDNNTVLGAGAVGLSPGNTLYPPLCGGGTVDSGPEAANQIVMPCSGTITSLYVDLVSATGAGQNCTATVRINGQDKALQVIVSGASATTGNASGSVVVAAGDLVSLGVAATAGSSNTTVHCSVIFQPTNSGYFVLSMSNNARNLSTGTTLNYQGLMMPMGPWGITNNRQQQNPMSFVAKSLYVKLGADPGNSKSYTFGLAYNRNSYGITYYNSNLTTTITGDGSTVTTGNYTDPIGITLWPNDLLNVYEYGTGTPTATTANISIAGYSIANGYPRNRGDWCWFQNPRAVVANGKTYIAYMVGDKPYVAQLDGTTVIVSPPLKTMENDDHDTPSLYVRQDGKIQAFYSYHASANKYVYSRKTTNPYDITTWDAEIQIGSPNNYTYTQPVYLSTENKLYLFTRTFPSDFNWNFATSSDDGDTWTDFTPFATDPYKLYCLTYGNGTDTIYITLSQHPFYTTPDVYFTKLTGGKLYKADGTLIGDSSGFPYAMSSLEKVYDHTVTGDKSWIWDIQADILGNPAILYSTFPLTTDHRYNYARWTGSVWVKNQITAAGGTIYESAGAEDYYSGGMCFDRKHINCIYLSKFVNQFEIQQGITYDNGVHWTFNSITSNTQTGILDKNVRPLCPTNYISPISVLWMYGKYKQYDDTNTNLLSAYLPGVTPSGGGLGLGLSPSGGNFNPAVRRQ